MPRSQGSVEFLPWCFAHTPFQEVQVRWPIFGAHVEKNWTWFLDYNKFITTITKKCRNLSGSPKTVAVGPSWHSGQQQDQDGLQIRKVYVLSYIRKRHFFWVSKAGKSAFCAFVRDGRAEWRDSPSLRVAADQDSWKPCRAGCSQALAVCSMQPKIG